MPVHAALPRPLRLIEPKDVVCPAGDPLGGVAVHCGVEQFTIDARTSPRSIDEFCCGNYRECPSWRAHKEAYWADMQREFDRGVEAS